MRLVIFGDTLGVPQLLKYIPREYIVALVGASIRPQYIDKLKLLSEKYSIPFIIQPKFNSSKYPSFLKSIKETKPDLYIVNSYSMVIREDVLSASQLGGINVHGALLPRNRGCNPTQWAIINGDTITGVTMHQLDNHIDTGAIIDQKVVPIFFKDSWIDIKNRLEEATDQLIADNLKSILSNNWKSRIQDEGKAKYGKRRNTSDGEFKWSDPIIEIYNKVRALLPPIPPAYFVDSSGEKHQLIHFHSINQLIKKKYDIIGRYKSEEGHHYLRPIIPSDANLLKRLSLNENLIKSEFEILNFIEKYKNKICIENSTKNSDQITFAIESNTKDSSKGFCTISVVNWYSKKSEIKFFPITNDFFESHFIDLIKCLLNFSFKELKLNEIYINISRKSIYLKDKLEQLGFKKEGKFRDFIVLSILNNDFEQMNVLSNN